MNIPTVNYPRISFTNKQGSEYTLVSNYQKTSNCFLQHYSTCRGKSVKYALVRFLKAQNHDYAVALQEIKCGCKLTHWIWYIFPQLMELGRSSTAKYYGINGIGEATAFLKHPVLCECLIEISTALLSRETSDPTEVLGKPDDMKVRSCMTLFPYIHPEIAVFQAMIDKCYNGKLDERTITLFHSYEMQKG